LKGETDRAFVFRERVAYYCEDRGRGHACPSHRESKAQKQKRPRRAEQVMDISRQRDEHKKARRRPRDPQASRPGIIDRIEKSLTVPNSPMTAVPAPTIRVLGQELLPKFLAL
jgi:hypothetical protein